jgi:hypothetical protein
MIQYHDDTKELLNDWLDSNIEDMYTDYYENSIVGLAKDQYQEDEDFRQYCLDQFEQVTADIADYLYEQWKDQQHN